MPDETLIEHERDKYERMWNVKDYRMHSPGEKCAQAAIGALQAPKGSTFIDFGCGTGRPAVLLQKLGMSVTAVDHVDNCLDPGPAATLNFLKLNLWQLPPNLEADYGFCTDVMEHIPTERVDAVLQSIATAVRVGAYFKIALFHDGFGKRIGETLHLTVWPKEEWTYRLRMAFPHVDIRSDVRNMTAVCRK